MNSRWLVDRSDEGSFHATIWEDHTDDGSDPHLVWEASVRFDGCIHLNRHFEEPGHHPPIPDYLHICDIDELIENLQALKQEALLRFGEGWPA